MSKSILLLLVVCFLIHCGVKNPAEDIKVKLIFESTELTVSGQIIDVSSGQNIKIPVNLSIQGNDSDKIVDVYGHQKTSFKCENGFFQFGVQKGTELNAGNPLEIIVLASADGFMSSNTTLIINEKTDRNEKIYMVNLASTLPGVEKTILDNVRTDENGALISDVMLTCGGTMRTGGAAATVSIARGTLLKDDQGQPVTGAMTLQMIYYNYKMPDSYRYFPGGSSAAIERDADGRSLQDVFFQNLGFISLQLSSTEGQRISAIDPGIELICDIPAGTPNPLTGQLITSGDELPVWQYNSLSGKWSFNQIVTVRQETGSHPTLMESLIDDKYVDLFLNNPWVMACIVVCAIAVPLAVDEDEEFEQCDFGWLHILGNPDKLHLDLSISYWLQECPLRRRALHDFAPPAVTTDNTYEHTLPNLWGSDSIFIEDGEYGSAWITAYYEGDVVGFKSFDNYCAAPTRHELTISPPDVDVITSNVRIIARCADNPDLVILPEVPVYCRKLPSPNFRFIGMVSHGGIVLPGLEIGREYVFLATYEKSQADTTVTITRDLEHVRLELDIPRGECP